jgi:hypothetical protein
MALVIAPPATDMRAMQTLPSSYVQRQIFPQGGVQPTLSLTSQSQISFTIPGSQVINLSASELSLNVVAGAVSAVFSYIHTGCLPIDTIELKTSRGLQLCYINNFRQYQRMVNPIVMKTRVMKQSPSSTALGTAAVTSVSAPGANVMIPGWDDTSYFIGSASTRVASLAEYDDNYKYVTSATTNAAVSVYWRVRLGDLVPHSVLSMANDLITGDDLQLNITLAAGQNVVLQAADALFGTPVAYAGTATYSNCYVWAACQANPQVCNLIKASAAQGVELPCQFVRGFFDLSLPSGGASLLSMQRPLNSSLGRSVLRHYGACFQADDSKALSANNYAALNVLYSAYRLYLNSVPQSDAPLSLAEAYRRMQPLLAESVAASYEHWTQHGATQVDDFSGLPSASDLACKTPIGGLALSEPVNWVSEISRSSTTFATVFMEFFVFQRVLRISPAGVELF